MKLHHLVFLFASVSARTLTGERAARVLANARRLEDGDDDAVDEFDFLTNYKLQLRSCVNGQTVRNSQTGNYEFSAVLFRLCPDNGECNSSGCDSGYGDYMVGLNTFMYNYLAEQQQNNQQDDNYNMVSYSQCRQYQANDYNDDDGNGNSGDNENGNDDGVYYDNSEKYYIGPSCTNDGKDVKLIMYEDYVCQYPDKSTNFESISNGQALPYSDGGLISTGGNSGLCVFCGQNDGNGYVDTNELCESLYQFAGKCETHMEDSPYGKDESYCEYIHKLKWGGNAAKLNTIALFILVAAAVALAGFVYLMKKTKTRKLVRTPINAGDRAGDGLLSDQ